MCITNKKCYIFDSNVVYAAEFTTRSVQECPWHMTSGAKLKVRMVNPIYTL
jgi:hypothetical protein